MIKKSIRLSVIIPIALTASVMASAQLLPQKQENNSVKIDRALIFKVDYEDETVAPDSTSKKSNLSSNETKKKDDPIINSLIGTGVCIAEATLITIFNGNSPLACVPLPNPKF